MRQKLGTRKRHGEKAVKNFKVHCIAKKTDIVVRLSYTNAVGDSSRESSVLGGNHEPIGVADLRDQEVASLPPACSKRRQSNLRVA